MLDIDPLSELPAAADWPALEEDVSIKMSASKAKFRKISVLVGLIIIIPPSVNVTFYMRDSLSHP
ncbi:MAG: hypothetical protein P4L42_06145 [Desulfocapsaceae bacterium]|nr:hypothetical protein [Desulfocapsaceae bacterium]